MPILSIQQDRLVRRKFLVNFVKHGEAQTNENILQRIRKALEKVLHCDLLDSLLEQNPKTLSCTIIAVKNGHFHLGRVKFTLSKKKTDYFCYVELIPNIHEEVQFPDDIDILVEFQYQIGT